MRLIKKSSGGSSLYKLMFQLVALVFRIYVTSNYVTDCTDVQKCSSAHSGAISCNYQIGTRGNNCKLIRQGRTFQA